MPGGAPLGKQGTAPRAGASVREVEGGVPEAEELFRELTEGGTEATPPEYPGTLIELPQGRGKIGLRSDSKSGPPTIDVNVVDANGEKIPVKKIKFVQ